ncbi:hypothetical protein AXX12_08635 [Anaerosporomusa subterranea]|uniref:Glycosyltransferase 2-like domain-containing protein n=1 Tax=Anaerosporomusa subterranea TaxID=1794912 RepID=A0A154BRF9_ANASB|nr:glycosyltransferase family 2 protein [Anaerosporomusa subterranea]KYZ76489.1 hypothetical protein AXX12_08635 [Anaerosporomusa subterranea]
MHEISLCMIVKNEEDNLALSLERVAQVIKDIVVVDTGSKDRTKEIARKFTEKVYDFPWCNDFSKSRNFASSKADNDWILVLDADEVLVYYDWDNIVSFIAGNATRLGTIEVVSEFESDSTITRSTEVISRLFNRKFFHYTGTIHEQLVRYDAKDASRAATSVKVEHSGYSKAALAKKDKIKRNVSLLEAALQGNPEDPYLHYQLGKIYFTAKRFVESCEEYYIAISLRPNHSYSYVENLVISYGYALLKCERYKDALVLLDYYNDFNCSADYLFITALILMNNSQFQDAVEQFSKCLGCEKARLEGVNTYLPLYNMGVIHECLGYMTIAKEYYRRCGDYQLARQRLKVLSD